MDALTYSGKPFHYYFVSRKKAEEIEILSKEHAADGAMIYAVLKEDTEKLVMIRQYRYPMDSYFYEFPAGLIEKGETAKQAAVRELKEETGFDFEPYEGGNVCARKLLYMGPGFTDESNQTVFGYVSGTATKQFQEDTESIQVCIVDKAEAKRILQEEKVTMRGAFMLLHFLQTQKENPFSFLNF